jgi:hypothetical protein
VIVPEPVKVTDCVDDGVSVCEVDVVCDAVFDGVIVVVDVSLVVAVALVVGVIDVDPEVEGVVVPDLVGDTVLEGVIVADGVGIFEGVRDAVPDVVAVGVFVGVIEAVLLLDELEVSVNDDVDVPVEYEV